MAQASLWIVGAFAVFYAFLGVVVIRRSMQHSCRVCLYWQDCLAKGLISSPHSNRCASAETHS
jgi:hypothetical protein